MTDRKDGGHTPGPWMQANPFSPRIIVAPSEPGIDTNANPQEIALIHLEATGDPIREAKIEALANARLIASAPDLLEACEILIRFIGLKITNENPAVPSEVRFAKAAISKAREGSE